MKRLFLWKLALLVAISISFMGCQLWTIVDKKEKAKGDEKVAIYFQDDSFNAKEFVESIWSEKLIPYVDDKKIDFETLVKGLNQDSEKTLKNYAVNYESGDSKANFITNIEAKVLAVDTSSKSGIMAIDIKPFDGEKDAIVQIGPVIRKNVVRDSIDFIKFDDYSNQVQFAQIATELNKKIYKENFSNKDPQEYLGKSVKIIGAFDNKNLDDLVITPILFETSN